ncbi:bifunctional glutamate N-acetyltransferase/amino-acid acetyltransferase ArgJ [Aeromicrobium duanguangcaii]|uniref:Arginine biosynthesis bifunctional protein ArgJ n=1 Tax=Aeromicrobium duanguangcaii TaxID=2968086 RepID=A0ABY5KAU7_9ACTN|nr:bifunctional glutamate N-acetyltransferase/amino-acid acetyltransferase ArgJ [Aeromicrobium duanguangcaii]MCD9155039.1 bifunctional glutamate N-acetyltransferase/amino-acid acetyltransferase ArgJ [Aeromicrobium duanguangcaii]UUI67557.1 bifunctional glutamate N-acetyltransferase/amino-acid acetyltransferase ArgJ [Aeromicrobium duanguangcaii]
MSVTAAQGFRAAGVTAGLKDSGKPDISLVVNEGPSSAAAAVFTSNRCKAHPVIWSEQAIKGGSARAIVLNSGGANCYTGPEGFAATHRTAERVAEHLGIGAIDVQVCSTGLIGRLLDEPKVLAGVDAAFAALSPDGGHDAATAIMTTDTVDKQATGGGDGWVIGGMAKGAGMLAPALATMLVVITTDADVDATTLDTALRSATAVSFDRLDSDGCQSTNDTVLVMASGASGVSPDPAEFTEALTTVCRDLALQLLADAEGADHEIAITTINAASGADALEVGRSVARSNLFKTAIYGKDPNWGRILASVGTTQAQFDPIDLDVAVNDVWVCRNSGVGESIDLVDLEQRSVTVTIDLKSGDHSATIWTNDLTHAYVHENSAYST